MVTIWIIPTSQIDVWRSRQVSMDLIEVMCMNQNTVLVVDDEPSFCYVMKEVLNMTGYKVRLAYNATQALGSLQEFRPNLILLDVMLPKIDGLSLLRRIRMDPALADIPTLVVSAKSENKEKQAARQAGADDFLAKPFSLRQLQDALSNLAPLM